MLQTDAYKITTVAGSRMRAAPAKEEKLATKEIKPSASRRPPRAAWSGIRENTSTSTYGDT